VVCGSENVLKMPKSGKAQTTLMGKTQQDEVSSPIVHTKKEQNVVFPYQSIL
jgi:hypothetical protein